MNKLITEIAEKYGNYFNAHADRQMLEKALQEYHDRLIEKVAADSSAISCHAEMWLKQQRDE